MHPGFIWQAVYWLSTPVLGVVAAILLWRKLQRDFPLFAVYIVVLILIDLARLLAYWMFPGKPYFYVYWSSDGLATLFAFLAAGELMLNRLFPQFYKLRFYRYLFLFAAVLIACFALVTAFSSNPRILLSALIRVLHTADVLLTAMLLFFVGLMVFMGRQWRRYEFGIALGLGINAAALLLTFAIFTKIGSIRGSVASLIPTFGDDAAALTWLLFFLRPERSASVPTEPVSADVLKEAREWQETLRDSVTGRNQSG